MQRREIISSIIGLVCGALFGGFATWLFAPEPVIWLASITGSVFGLIGGALGQNFIEGIVIAVVCFVGLLFILTAPLPGNDSFFWWIRECFIGLLVGTAVGWFAHGAVGGGPW